MYESTEVATLSDAEPIFLLKARAAIVAVRSKQSGPAQDQKYARQFRRELGKLGYRAVSQAFEAQLPVMSWSDPFRTVTWNGRAPSMEFVREWLDAEERAHRTVQRLLFWGTMAATVVSVLVAISGAV